MQTLLQRKYLNKPTFLMRSLLLLTLLTCLPAAAQTRVNVGGPQYTDAAGNVWAADYGCTSNLPNYSYSGSITGTPDPTLSQTGRTATSTLNCTYTVSSSPVFYLVTLLFAETNSTVTRTNQGPGAKPRIMNVYINNQLYWAALNVYASSNFATAYTVTSPYIAVTTGQISINVSQTSFQPMLSGIDIEPVATVVVLSSADAIYPESYGALHNGVHDDCPAINLAIAQALTSGLPVQLSGGTYLCNSTKSAGKLLVASLPSCNIAATIPCGFTIFGAGAGLTRIKTTTAAADLLSVISPFGGSPITNVRGFTIQGPDPIASPPCVSKTSGNGLVIDNTGGGTFTRVSDINAFGFCGAGKAAIYMANFENSSLRDSIAQYSNIGVKWAGSPNADLADTVLVAVNLTYGFDNESGDSDTHTNLTVQSNAKTGYYCNSCTRSAWTGTHFENNNTTATVGQFGLWLDATGGQVTGNVFNASSFNGTHENMLLKASGGHNIYANEFHGGVANSVATPFITEDGPLIAGNLWSLLADAARFSYLNTATQQDEIHTIGEITSGGDPTQYIPFVTTAKATTFANIPALACNDGATWRITDSTTQVNGVGAAGGGALKATIVCSSGNWFVVSK